MIKIMSPEHYSQPVERVPKFDELGTDINESLLSLETLLKSKLGDLNAVYAWWDQPNMFLGGKTPNGAIHTTPDKVVEAAYRLGQFNSEDL